MSSAPNPGARMNNVSKQTNYCVDDRTWSAVYCIHPTKKVWAAWVIFPDGSIEDAESFDGAVNAAYYESWQARLAKQQELWEGMLVRQIIS